MHTSAMDKVDFDLILDREFDALEVKVDVSDGELLSKKYPARSHARKVVKELRRGGAHGLEKGIIYLPGEPTRQFENSDQGPELRQRRYFYYITGVDLADCAVTYEISRDRLTVWIPFVEPRQALWFGTVPDAAQALQLYDVDDVRYTKDLTRFLNIHLDRSTTLFLLSKDQSPCATTSSGIAVDTSSLRPAMDRARVIKDAHEIALIRRANAISSAAHREIARHLLRLRNEQDIQAIFLAACTARGAHSQAYPIIAGAGPNAATLHYGANDQPLRGRDLVVVDAGCEFRCYASDITRTLPISGRFTRESGRIHDIVQRMQDECIAAVRPGVKFYELHLLAASIAVDGLLELGILKGERDAVAASRVVSAFFPHGLGHHVGLEVHDVTGDERLLYARGGQRVEAGKREILMPLELAALGSSGSGSSLVRSEGMSVGAGDDRQTLQPGMIVTVEPGIYFHRDYIKGYFLSRPEFARYIDTEVLESYYSVGGVRIEDDILVTRGGYENLTTAPKGEEMLDIINGTYEMV